MKPTWDALAQEYATSDKVVVADVDCTAEGKDLCERFGVQGFPTIKYFNPPDEEGEDYEGGRDAEALKTFAATLGPGCSAAMLDKCSAEEKAELEKYMTMPEADRLAEIEVLKAGIKAKEDAHEKLVEGLQKSYEESQKSVEDFKKEVSPKLKMLKSAAPAKAAGKDEM
tara:strand:- start:133 stop:639 length:507 start_codon:yes stop_codon:yes gene_type:complete